MFLSYIRQSNFFVVNRQLASVIGLNESILLMHLADQYDFYARNGKLISHGMWGDGWFYETIEKTQELTTLTRRQQDGAISSLIEQGIIEKQSFGMPAKRHFRIQEQRLMEIFEGIQKNITSLYKNAKLEKNESKKSLPVCTKTPNQSVRKRQTIYKDNKPKDEKKNNNSKIPKKPPVKKSSKAAVVVSSSEKKEKSKKDPPKKRRKFTDLDLHEKQQVQSLLEKAKEKTHIENPGGWIQRCIDEEWHKQEVVNENAKIANKKIAQKVEDNFPFHPRAAFYAKEDKCLFCNDMKEIEVRYSLPTDEFLERLRKMMPHQKIEKEELVGV